MLKKYGILSVWCAAYVAICAAAIVASLCGWANAAMYIAMGLTFLPFGPAASAVSLAVSVRRGNERRVPLIWLVVSAIMWIIAIIVLVSSTGGV